MRVHACLVRVPLCGIYITTFERYDGDCKIVTTRYERVWERGDRERKK